MTSLDSLVRRARDLEVRPDHARAYVDELARWSRVQAEPRRRWLPWLAGGFALAAAAVLALVLLGRARVLPAEVVTLGDRVAIVAAPGTSYRVERADAERTTIAVERGTVTARLWPSPRAHRLVLHGAGIEAAATGTIYSLSVDARGASVSVHEGEVEVRAGERVEMIVAGTRWPADREVVGGEAARALAIAAMPASLADAGAAPQRDAGTTVDAEPTASDAARPPVRDRGPTDAAAPTPAWRDRFRHARLLRGQGKLDEALAECLAIAGARDATWSPIALVEAVRIELGPRAQPERAIELAERFEREWPAHGLAPEARELRCRALKQLGRPCPTTP